MLKTCTTYSEGAVNRATKLVCGAEHNSLITQMVHTKDYPAEPQGCLPELFKIGRQPIQASLRVHLHPSNTGCGSSAVLHLYGTADANGCSPILPQAWCKGFSGSISLWSFEQTPSYRNGRDAAISQILLQFFVTS